MLPFLTTVSPTMNSFIYLDQATSTLILIDLRVWVHGNFHYIFLYIYIFFFFFSFQHLGQQPPGAWLKKSPQLKTTIINGMICKPNFYGANRRKQLKQLLIAEVLLFWFMYHVRWDDVCCGLAPRKLY